MTPPRTMPPHDARVFIHQIFFDDASRKSLDAGFIALDNTDNLRPDWYEFWVIRRYLLTHRLQDDGWYGFLSPSFGAKTGLLSRDVFGVIASVQAHANVVLCSPDWEQLAYFQNPFEQGELWHPGLSAAAQQFFDHAGVRVDIRTLVTHASTSVFSNYVIAKAPYWHRWLDMAEKYFAYIEGGPGAANAAQLTSYGSATVRAPMKTFVQERFASVILAQGGFQVACIDQSDSAPIFTRLFDDDPRTRRLLQCCDVLKERYCATGDPSYLSTYRNLRAGIRLKNPQAGH